MRFPLVSLLLAAGLLGTSACGADRREAAVTADNLLESERYWPYRVELRRSAASSDAATSPEPGVPGVLIRVEPEGIARIDFGRDGLREVPIAATDLVERANLVRSGELEKAAPNFAFAIGPRLLDSESPSPRLLPVETAAAMRGFLCVFADPASPEFEELAGALAGLGADLAVLTLLFPQGEHPDGEVAARLRSLDWKIPFLPDHLAEAYTRKLVSGVAERPTVTLQTAEGRLVFESAWDATAANRLAEALAETFGSGSAHSG